MQRESKWVVLLVVALVMSGVFMVYSAAATHDDPLGSMFRQLAYAGAGLVALLAASRFDYHRFGDPVIYRPLALVGIALLVLVLLPSFGVERLGARRWLDIQGFRFQPSEVIKFVVIILLATKLSKNQDEIKNFWTGLVPPLAIMILFTGLIVAENDLGTPVVIGAVAYSMMMIAGVRWRHLLPSLIPAVAAVAFLIESSAHRKERILAFLDPWAYDLTHGYQLIQSMSAFARGGVYGVGPGAGEQKRNYLPEAESDFIFSVWGEEMGLVGTFGLVALYVVLIVVAVRITLNAPDLFGALLAGGVVSLIAIQTLVNMCVTLGLMPTKGLPLPFVSSGGSSLIVFMGLMGILVSVGLQASTPVPGHARAKAA